MKIRFYFLTLMAFLCFNLNAQFSAGPPQDWFHLDYGQDGYQGASTDKMYERLKGKKSNTVIVAVIDSGVDAEHEDLKDVMWINEDEIPNNGIDDDKNGYVDDIHGWNFLGNKNGENVAADQLESTRLYVKYKKKYGNKSESEISKKDKKEYKLYKKFERIIKDEQEKAAENLAIREIILEAIGTVQEEIGKEDFTSEDLESYNPTKQMSQRYKMVVVSLLDQGFDLMELVDAAKSEMKHFKAQLDFHYNVDADPRKIVGDNYADSYEKGYGNNDVEGPDANHGTHVAGIIAAKRGNGIGMDGIADNVKIMSLRAVPDGDERDKDVANAIIYAVDNGASVVNMSFGKSYSWDKNAVDKAVKYAMKHDVLLVHAAGNSSKDNDKADNFPNDNFEKKGLFKPKKAKNWLEVGALSWQGGQDSPAFFSNYGKSQVDVFSPGVDIYSTTPNNEYESNSGTSMASPLTAGLAAVIRSYFPDLSAEQVKDIIMESTVAQNNKVAVPGSGELVSFKELCQTGGIVSGYRAVELANKTKGIAKKKNRKFRIDSSGSSPSSKKSVVTP